MNARLPVLLRWLADSRPEVACPQEFKAAQEKFPADAIWHGQKAWNGVAILTRSGEPVETRRGLAGDPFRPGARHSPPLLPDPAGTPQGWGHGTLAPSPAGKGTRDS